MNIKVNGPGRTGNVDKKKKTQRSGESSGVNFSDLLESLQGASALSPTAPTRGVGGVGGYVGNFDEEAPKDAQGRSNWLVERLEELQRDILAGEPTQAVERLRRALADKALDLHALPPQVRALVEEIELRASVEMAKIEMGKKRS